MYHVIDSRTGFVLRRFVKGDVERAKAHVRDLNDIYGVTRYTVKWVA